MRQLFRVSRNVERQEGGFCLLRSPTASDPDVVACVDVVLGKFCTDPGCAADDENTFVQNEISRLIGKEGAGKRLGCDHSSL